METKQLNNYKIDFYSKEEFREFSITKQIDNSYNVAFGDRFNNAGETYCSYAGLVSEIPEELAEKIVDKSEGREDVMCFKDYSKEKHFTCSNPKQSFQTLSELPYCVITKIE